MTTRRIFLGQCLGAAAAGPLLGAAAKTKTPAKKTAKVMPKAAVKKGSIITNARDAGYRGIWFTLGQKCPYGDKYSGGLGTYTANHVPIAIHVPEVKKTFFVYGGSLNGERHLLNMASYYDHERHVVPRPTIVHDKKTVDDPHDNSALAIDGDGFLWVFISGRGQIRPGFIYRSLKPYDTSAFEQVVAGEFTYPQPRWFPGKGFLFLFTKYTKGRELYYSTSPDGLKWAPDKKFAGMGGHYQTSHVIGDKVVTAFNYHPGGSVDKRTNLYYLQTDDMGATWRNDRGQAVTLPLADPVNPALVREYEKEKLLVYIHDLDLDAQGRPVIVYNTSHNYAPGPDGDPRWLTVAHWLGDTWDTRELTRMNHNYSTSALYMEKGGPWRIIGPCEKGPQPIGSGGEIAIWRSTDEGKSWRKERDVTRGSALNHNYVRRPINPNPEFYAFWADGNPDTLSKSELYFSNQPGDKVWKLPYDMKSDFAEPELVKF